MEWSIWASFKRRTSSRFNPSSKNLNELLLDIKFLRRAFVLDATRNALALRSVANSDRLARPFSILSARFPVSQSGLPARGTLRECNRTAAGPRAARAQFGASARRGAVLDLF